MASNSEWLARKLLELEQQVQALGRGTRLGHSSLQGGSILALDEDGKVLVELGTDGGAGGVVHLDGPEPPRPTAPVLEQGVGTIFVRWDGDWDPLVEGDDGELPTTPLDFDRIEVHATTDPEATEWDEDTLAGSITQRNGGVVMIRGWDIDDVVIVRLVCRSLADKVSEPSEPAEVTVTGIDIAAIVDELDAANVELANLDGTMFAANAELDALRIQFKNLDTSIINTDDGTLTEALEDARQALEDAKAEAKSYTDQAIADIVVDAPDGTKTIYSLNDPTGEYVKGSTWYKIDTDENIIGQWSQDGGDDTTPAAVWTPRAMTDSMVTSLNAAKIDAGIIDAARIGAGSITADKLLIGGAQNLIPGVQPGTNRGMSEFVWDDTEKALTPVTSGRATVYADEPFFLAPGEYVVEADIKASVEGTRTYIGALGLTPAWNYRYGISNVLVSTEWQHFAATLSIPEGDEGEVRARFLPAYSGDNTATTWYRNVTFRRMTSSVLIENGAVTADKVAADAITADKVSANAIGARAIAADAIEAGKIAADAITGREIAANSISAEQIVGLSITADELAANSISTSKLVSSAVIADKIAANAVTTAKLDALAVTADKVAANAITADKIAANAITAGKIDSDAINGMVITGATIRTGATGARVELNPSGLSAWNSAGTRTFNIDQATGQVEAVGSVYSGLPGQQRVVLDHAAFASGATYTDEDGNTVAGDGAGLILGEDGDAGRRATIGFMTPATGVFRRPSLRLQGPSAFGTAFLDLGMAATLRGSSSVGSGRVRLSDGVVSTESSGPTLIKAGTLVRLTGDSEIDLQAGGTEGSQVRVQATRIDTTAPTSIVFGTGTGSDLTLTSDSVNPILRSRAVLNRTYSYAANVYVTTSGILSKSTSARRYKTDEQEIAPAEYADALLSIPFKSWLDKVSLEQQAELEQFREDNPYCPTPEYLADAGDGLVRHVGAVAEDFIDAGLDQFVTFDQYGRVDGLQYDRIGVALIPIIKGMKEQIDRLEAANGIGE